MIAAVAPVRFQISHAKGANFSLVQSLQSDASGTLTVIFDGAAYMIELRTVAVNPVASAIFKRPMPEVVAKLDRPPAGEILAPDCAEPPRSRPDLARWEHLSRKGLEDGFPQKVASSAESKNGGIVAFRPVAMKQADARRLRDAREEKPRKVKYRSLLAAYDPQPVAKPTATDAASPKRFIPFGTLLKCKLVNTVDSANLETPVIAVLLEDVWQNGERVIPANTLVHGTARAGRLRDRVMQCATFSYGDTT